MLVQMWYFVSLLSYVGLNVFASYDCMYNVYIYSVYMYQQNLQTKKYFYVSLCNNFLLFFVEVP